MKHMLIFGMGFSGRAIARRLAKDGWRITGTSRTPDGLAAIKALGHEALLFTGEAPGEGITAAVNTATHVLVSAGPDANGDPVLAHHRKDLAAAPALTWIGYLSTVGVYGDFGGAWVDETAALKPASTRGRRRVKAEAAWQEIARETTNALHIFRLAGIYGPGRSPLAKLKAGTARRIAKPGQVFNRIHVEDIAGVIAASITRPNPGAIYNVADDEPAPPQDVVVYAASLLGIEPPPETTFDNANMTPMARSFYGENKRVSNARLKDELEYRFQYPTFREGLRALADSDAGQT